MNEIEVSLLKEQEHKISEIEAVLKEIWKKILKIPEVSSKDNFFELGGDSIKAMLLTVEISSLYGYDMPLPNLVTANLHDLATTLANHRPRRSILKKLLQRLYLK